jgi:hypothetical protein
MSAKARFWAFFPVALIVTMVGSLVAMALVASHDPSFAIEKDYYKKAIAYDVTQAQAQENARLGWHVECSLLTKGRELEVVAVVKDKNGARIENAAVDVEAFANARASRIVTARLEPSTDQRYAGRVPLGTAGLWEFRFTVEARGSRFTEVVREDVRVEDAS